MIIAIDFDDCVVSQRGRDYGDTATPLRFMPGAKAGLLSLRAAGHTLLLYSARSNRSLREDPLLDPLIRAGIRRIDMARWEKSRAVNEARYQQMLAFVVAQVPGIFDAVDDGMQGKPCADLFLDDKALRFGNGVVAVGWRTVSQMYGEPFYSEVQNVA